MSIHPRRALSVLTSSLTLSLVVLLASPSWAAEKARLRAPQAGSGAVQHPADRAADIILALKARGLAGR